MVFPILVTSKHVILQVVRMKKFDKWDVEIDECRLIGKARADDL